MWRLVTGVSHIVVPLSDVDRGLSSLDDAHRALRRRTHNSIRRVSSDLDPRAHLNTAVSALMELVNDLYAFCDQCGVAVSGASQGDVSRSVPLETTAVLKEAVETLVLMLSPFPTHMCEELWERLGHTGG